jgi:hypothetical protein
MKLPELMDDEDADEPADGLVAAGAPMVEFDGGFDWARAGADTRAVPMRAIARCFASMFFLLKDP